MGQNQCDAPALQEQLNRFSAARGTEAQLAWTIFSVFWAAQVLLLGVLFQREELPPRSLGLIASVAGIGMSVAWGLVQHRSLRHLERYEDVIKKLEEDLRIREEHRLTMEKRFRGVPARTVLRASTWATGIAWVGSLITFACCCRS